MLLVSFLTLMVVATATPLLAIDATIYGLLRYYGFHRIGRK